MNDLSRFPASSFRTRPRVRGNFRLPAVLTFGLWLLTFDLRVARYGLPLAGCRFVLQELNPVLQRFGLGTGEASARLLMRCEGVPATGAELQSVR
jgi:hypothetical protein